LVCRGTKSNSYIYSAAGKKLAKEMTNNTYQYYAGNMVYKNDKSLNYLLFDEGLVNKVSGGYAYEYQLKDHLGNTRVTFQPNGSTTTTTQVAEYYPFGSSYLPVSPAGTNKYLYNGKEKQDDVLGGAALDWYDYGARFYDAQIGRWHTVDPMAEKYASITPYAYALNNPIIFIDPDGREIDISELMKSKDHANAFVIFAGTKEGKAFLNNYASKGQKLEYDGKVFYEAKGAGKFDKAGVDLNFKVSSDKESSGTSSKINGVNDFDVNIDIAKEGFGSDSKAFNLVKAISHETFLHADNEARDVMDGKIDNSSVQNIGNTAIMQTIIMSVENIWQILTIQMLTHSQ